MFRFRRSKKHDSLQDEDQEYMTGKGSSFKGGIALDGGQIHPSRGSMIYPQSTSNRSILTNSGNPPEMQPQQQEGKGRGGFPNRASMQRRVKSSMASKSSKYPEPALHTFPVGKSTQKTKSSNIDDTYDQQRSMGSNTCSNSSNRENSLNHDIGCDHSSEDEGRRTPLQNNVEDDDDSYPSVGEFVVQQSKRKISGITKKGSGTIIKSSSRDISSNTDADERKNNVDKANRALSASLNNLSREQRKSKSSKNSNNISEGNSIPHKLQQRVRSHSSGVETMATTHTNATRKTSASDNTHTIQQATENAALQKLASIVISLRSDLAESNRQKEEIERKFKDVHKKLKAQLSKSDGTPATAPKDDSGTLAFLQELKEENIELKNDIDAFIVENDALTKEVQSLKEEKNAANEMIARLKKDRENECGSSTNSFSLSHMNGIGDSSTTVKSSGLSSITTHLENKNLQLQSKVDDLTEENRKLEGEIQLLVDEKQELVRMNSSAAISSRSHSTEIADLKRAWKEMEIRLEKQTTLNTVSYEHHTNIVAKLNEQIANLNKEKENLSVKLIQSSDVIFQMVQEVGDIGEKSDLKQLIKPEKSSQTVSHQDESRQCNIDLESMTKELKEKVDNLIRQHDLALKENDFIRSNHNKITVELNAANNDLNRTIEKNTVLDSITTDLKKKIDNLVMQQDVTLKNNDHLRAENSKILEELKVASSKAVPPSTSSEFSADTVLTLQKMISSLESTKEQLEADLAEKKAQIKSSETMVIQLEHSLQTQTELLSSQNIDRIGFEKQINDLIVENEGFKSQLDEFNDEKNMYLKEIEQLKMQISNSAELEEVLKDKEEKINDLKSSLMKLQSEHSMNVDTISNLQKIISSLEKSKDDVENELLEVSDAVSLLEDELDKKDAAVKGELIKVTVLRQELSQLEKDKSVIAEQVESLLKEAKEANTQIKVLILEKKIISEEMEVLKKQSSQEFDQLRNSLKCKDERGIELADEILALKGTISTLKSSKKRLEDQLQENLDASNVLKDELKKVEESWNMSEHALKEMEVLVLEKETMLQSMQSLKTKLQAEHQVSIETIASLQKSVLSFEKSNVELTKQLEESDETIIDLQKQLKESYSADIVSTLRNEIAELKDDYFELTKCMSDVTAENEKLKNEAKEILVKNIGDSSENVSVVGSNSAAANTSSTSEYSGEPIETLTSDSNHNDADRPMSQAHFNHQSDTIITTASLDDDMSRDTPVVEIKPCGGEISPKTISAPAKKDVISKSSSGTSRGSSLLEMAKKLCDELDVKRSKSSEPRKTTEPLIKVNNTLPKKLSWSESISSADKTCNNLAEKNNGDQEKNKGEGNDGENQTKKSKDDLGFDSIPTISFESCGVSVSKLSDISSDASSSLRRRMGLKNESLSTKKVKICRNGVFMGTYEGELNKNGQRCGFGVLMCDNGNSYEGEWTNDKRDGLGIARYCSGDVYDGEWKRGKRQGHGVMYIESGDTYIGSWSNGLKHGAGTYHWSDGEVDVSWYEQDKRVGEGVRWNSTRTKAYHLFKGMRKEEISLEDAQRTARKLGLNLAKFDSESS